MTRPFSSAVESGNWDGGTSIGEGETKIDNASSPPSFPFLGAYVLGAGFAIKALSSLPFSLHLPKIRSWHAAALPHLTRTGTFFALSPLSLLAVLIFSPSSTQLES